ncbi:hypothetical protein HKW98_00400 [Stutzerimonas urumqiensis]|uniref:hypothetical protein n=1 Tax=Stutzerimonas urumqiensis TaxID=638269 RepID=UPI003BACA401
MKAHRLLLVMGMVAACSGCATGLNSFQKSELRSYEARGLAVEEKNPGMAAVLGLLPGGGSFYGREYGLGVVNLLFWPLSIMWDPISGHSAAESINYGATKAHVARLQKAELDVLDEQLRTGQIDLTGYTLAKNKIAKQYDAN